MKSLVLAAVVAMAALAGCATQEVAAPEMAKVAAPPVAAPRPAPLPLPPPVMESVPSEAAPSPVSSASATAAPSPKTPKSAKKPAGPNGAAAKPPAAANGSPDYAALVAAEFAKLKTGKILFNPPKEMTVGHSERIEVRISQDISQDLIEGLKGKGEVQIKEIRVGAFMKAVLSGGKAFAITPHNPEAEQVVVSPYTQWSWDVLPIDAGEHELHLLVTVRLALPGMAEKTYDHPVIDKPIRVKVNLPYTVKMFVAEYWQWLIATLLLPLIAWLWKAYGPKPRP